MPLAVPLSVEQIAAANRLHSRLKQWTLSDRALARLAETVPGFDVEACLLKTVAVNALYGTQVFAVVRMARHVEQVLASTDITTADEGLVEDIAALPVASRQKTVRRHHSFAAKFCHFFVDTERFPIMDRYASDTLKYHLGETQYVEDEEHPYHAYITNLRRLAEITHHKGSSRDLDHYLWITGQYMKYDEERKRGKEARINAELKELFETPSAEDAADLHALLPSILDQAFKGEL